VSGKHAPASPKSFYLSLARTGSVLAAVIAVVVAIGLVATGGSPSKGHPSPPPTTPASATDTIAPSQSATVAPAPVSVIVLNATGRQGLAKLVAVRITEIDGFSASVPKPGNATPTNTTTIFVRDDAIDAAQRLRRAAFPFMKASAIKLADRTSPGAEQAAPLTVVLGLDYPAEPSDSPSPRKRSPTPTPT